jgi:hypothetical protein
MITFPKNPPSVTSLGALSRSFKSGFFSGFAGGGVGIAPQIGGMFVGSKVVEVSIAEECRDKIILYVDFW